MVQTLAACKQTCRRYMCVLVLLYTCSHTAAYVSSRCCVCVFILQYMCPHTATYVSSYCYMCPDTVAAGKQAGVLTYAHVCSRMLTNAHVFSQTSRRPPLRTHTYTHTHTRPLRRTSGTSLPSPGACGLELLRHAASRYQCMRPEATNLTLPFYAANVCGLKLLN